MSAGPLKPVSNDGDQADPDALFHEVKSLSDHELQLTIGAVKRPNLPLRWCHPVSVKFPGLDEDGYSALKEDIRRNGQRKAIAMLDGRIWDGRSRYDACIELGLVPKVWPLRREPIIYLLQRHGTRYGGPNTPERDVALKVLHEIETKEWKQRADKERSEWIAEARRDFKDLIAPSPQPCAVCGLGPEYSQAHHLLPLGLQYELGVDLPVQAHEWLCHVHHRAAHRLISARLLGLRNNESWRDDVGSYLSPDERVGRATLIAGFDRARALYESVGGILPRGNYYMLWP